MEPEPRSLPNRPSLRHLKLEAKRRQMAREFASLHEAQLAIATEYGLPSWAALKTLVVAQTIPSGHALAQLRWLIARFADAGRRGWVAPTLEELRLHFDDRLLTRVTPDRLLSTIRGQRPTFANSSSSTTTCHSWRAYVWPARRSLPRSSRSHPIASPRCGARCSANESAIAAWRRRRRAVPERCQMRWPRSHGEPSPIWVWSAYCWPRATQTDRPGL